MNSSKIVREIPLFDLREIQEISCLILSVLGLFSNILLLYLILKKTSPKLKSYQKILLQNCVADLIYNIANGVTKTQTDFKDGNFFFIMTSAIGPIPSPYSNILISFWVLSLCYCVTSLPVQFIYRYYLVVKEKRIDGKNYVFLLFSAFLFAFIYSIMTFLFLWPSETDYKEKSKLLEADLYYYRDHLIFATGDIRNISTIIQATYASVILNGSYIIIIWTSYKIWYHLKLMKSNMSAQTREIHRQMTKALIMQAIIPFLVCLLPIGITVIMTFLRANIDGLGIGISLVLSCIPIINSTTTILIVKSYRRTVISVFKRIIGSQAERYSSSIPNPPTSNHTKINTNSNNNKISQF